MIQVYNTKSSLEKYVYDIISINTGISFQLFDSHVSSDRLSIIPFQNETKFKGNTIYIYKSKDDLSKIESPIYLFDTNNISKKIPVFYSIYECLKKNVVCNFTNKFPAVWKDFDSKQNMYIVVNFDIIKNIAYHLVYFEEYDSPKRDSQFIMSTYQKSRLYNYDILDFPIVDYYINLFFELIKFINPKKFKRKKIWPNEKKYAVCLTHDVDNVRIKKLSKTLYRTFNNLKLKTDLRDRFKKLGQFYNQLLLKEDIFNNFDKWIKLESKYNMHSSFYFLSRGILESLISTDRRYSIKNKSLKNKIKEIYSKGWEVGLHGYCNSYNKLKQEKKLLESVLGSEPLGIRQHYLQINIPRTWEYYRNLGLKYDSSLGFSDALGFRAGTSYPFFPFDLKTNSKIDLLIIPLTIMDTCFIELNSNNPFNVIMDSFMKFKDIVASFGGVLTLLWHQEYYNDYEYPFLKKSYQEILSILDKDDNAYIGSGLEIYNAWLENYHNYEK